MQTCNSKNTSTAADRPENYHTRSKHIIATAEPTQAWAQAQQLAIDSL